MMEGYEAISHRSKAQTGCTLVAHGCAVSSVSLGIAPKLTAWSKRPTLERQSEVVLVALFGEARMTPILHVDVHFSRR